MARSRTARQAARTAGSRRVRVAYAATGTGYGRPKDTRARHGGHTRRTVNAPRNIW